MKGWQCGPSPVLLGAVIAGLFGCASTHPNAGWEEEAYSGVERPTRPASRGPARLQFTAPSSAPEAAAHNLRLALREFSRDMQRRQAAGPPPPTQGFGGQPAWGIELRRPWRVVLSEVETAFTHPPGTFSDQLLIQVRVILEAEKERATLRFGAPPESLSRRIEEVFAEVARRIRLRRMEAGTSRPPGEIVLQWPVSPIILTSGFGYRRDPVHRDGRLGFHAGLDLAGREGDIIRAAARGKVFLAGWSGGLGRAVKIKHRGGFTTVYGHMSKLLVTVGTRVEADVPIGLMGSSGRATGAHLHFELRLDNTPIDPIDYLVVRTP